MNNKSKRSQSELITTVLLILISITAVVIVSTFVINMVRTNLKGTECFQTTGQLSIDTGYSYFNTQTGILTLRIARGEKDFNLTGINVVYGNEFGTTPLKIRSEKVNETTSILRYIQINGTPTTNIAIPSSSETKVYTINTSGSGMTSVNTVALEAVVGKDTSCGKIDEQTISFKQD